MIAVEASPELAHVAEGWYKAKEVVPQVWQIDDQNAANIYLIEGTESALLIDTGIGAADLVSFVRRITSKPLLIVNTHGHVDHVGGNYQFSKVYMHNADTSLAFRSCTPKARESVAIKMQVHKIPADADVYRNSPRNPVVVAIKEGFEFDLGNRIIRVIETPGHTEGSICLLDVDHKLLFTGDSCNQLVWLFLPVSKPLSVYLKTLEKLSRRIDQFTTILPGHGDPLPNDFILDQIECVKSVLSGTGECMPYFTFAGESRICCSGRSSIAFNPRNL